MDPEAEKKQAAKEKSAAVLRRLDASGIRNDNQNQLDGASQAKREDLILTQYEQSIAMEVVHPDEIDVSFNGKPLIHPAAVQYKLMSFASSDIGGLSDIIEELQEAVIYPLTLPHLYAHSSSLLAAPSGVLLYGPPGCGKTMLAKALAHESGACFINLHISTLTEKWYGDSNKLVNAVFSLARKLQPTIVFIDEIDAVLGTRRSGEHEASGMVKAEFMTHWDGLTSSNTSGQPQRIVILGATNRPQDIDEAILRRMPKKFPVSLPSAPQRRKILELVLKDTKTDQGKFDLDHIVRLTAGMSGSDIKEACRGAAMMPMRECIRLKRKSGLPIKGVDASEVRGIRTSDFFSGKAGVVALPEQNTRARDTDSETATEEYTDTDGEEAGTESPPVDAIE
jgi:SpoVK/Ycf46/Vps4 family AAA+-type ATPase